MVLRDYQMPGMDGFEVARRIQQDTTLPPTRVAILTSMCHRLHRPARLEGVEFAQQYPGRIHVAEATPVNLILALKEALRRGLGEGIS